MDVEEIGRLEVDWRLEEELLSGFEGFGCFEGLDGLAVLLSFKCPFAVRRVASAYLRGGSLANDGKRKSGE